MPPELSEMRNVRKIGLRARMLWSSGTQGRPSLDSGGRAGCYSPFIQSAHLIGIRESQTASPDALRTQHPSPLLAVCCLLCRFSRGQSRLRSSIGIKGWHSA